MAETSRHRHYWRRSGRVHGRDVCRERPVPGALTRNVWRPVDRCSTASTSKITQDFLTEWQAIRSGPLLQQQAMNSGLGVQLADVEAVRLEGELKVLHTGDGEVQRAAR